jgi:hypothetical protein
MRRGEQLDPRGDLAGGADGDRRDVQHHRVDVDERPVADADRAVFAVEGRTHDDTLSPTRRSVRRSSASRSSHATGADPLNRARSSCTPSELCFVVGIVGDVQLAAQHPLSHLGYPSLIPRRSGVRAMSPPHLRQNEERSPIQLSDAERDEHVKLRIAAPDGLDIADNDGRSTPPSTTGSLGAGARTQAAAVRTSTRRAARYSHGALGGSIPAMSPTDIHIIHAAATHSVRLSRRGRG